MDGERRKGRGVEGGDRDWAGYIEGERNICRGRNIVYVEERDNMDRTDAGSRVEIDRLREKVSSTVLTVNWGL